MGEPPNTPDAKALNSIIQRIEKGVGALNEEVVELQKRAAMGGVAGLLAHEINNILTPVLSYARLAQRKDAGPETIEQALRETVEGIGRTTEIAAAILSLGSSGGTDQGTRSNVREVVRQSVAALGRDLSRDGISCQIRVPPDLEAAIAPTSLQQVLVNLLQNARLAMLDSGGGGSIEIDCSTWNTGRLRLAVADNGPGIDAKTRERIFEPFVRGGQNTPGTGLGLTVCRELLEAVGGTIHAEASASGGAKFVIELASAAEAASPHRAA